MQIEVTTYFSNQFKKNFVIKTGKVAPIRMTQFINAEELSEKFRARLLGQTTELPGSIQFLYKSGKTGSITISNGAPTFSDADPEGRVTFNCYGPSHTVRLFIWDHHEEPEATISAAQFEELFWATDALRIEDQRREEAEASAKRLADAMAKAERLEKELAMMKALNSALQSSLAEIEKINDAGGPGSRRKVREIIQRGM